VHDHFEKDEARRKIKINTVFVFWLVAKSAPMGDKKHVTAGA
jgi:hypothetical protein